MGLIQFQFRMAGRCAAEREGHPYGGDAKGDEHQLNGDRSLGAFPEKDAGHPFETHQPQVLHPVDEGEGGAQDFIRDNLGDGGPEGGGDQRIAEAQEHHGEVSPERDAGQRPEGDGR